VRQRSLLTGTTKHTPHLSLLLCWNLPSAVPANMDLSGPRCTVAPHPADLLHAAGMVPSIAMLRAKSREQSVHPLMDLPEVLAEFPATVLAVLLNGCHLTSPTKSQARRAALAIQASTESSVITWSE